GLIIHPFSNEKYIREVTLPALDRGLAKSGRSREDFEIAYTPFIISGKDEETFEKEKAGIKGRISFYGSTPAYKNVLGVHGWGEMQIELNKMSKEGKWAEMSELVTDDMLNVFGGMGEPDSIVAEIKSRYGDIVDRTSGGFGFVDNEKRQEMIAELRA
ncbi:MAG: LLM class flavin-dependent oxidoreductase, partial [Gammaproteobacteria bacterium]|nr:LLM class flavin-dependent oxidoreductase [Gammaproteobacteria bacterium]